MVAIATIATASLQASRSLFEAVINCFGSLEWCECGLCGAEGGVTGGIRTWFSSRTGLRSRFSNASEPGTENRGFAIVPQYPCHVAWREPELRTEARTEVRTGHYVAFTWSLLSGSIFAGTLKYLERYVFWHFATYIASPQSRCCTATHAALKMKPKGRIKWLDFRERVG